MGIQGEVVAEVDVPLEQHDDQLTVNQLTPAIGAEISGINLGSELGETTISEIRRLLVKHKILVFREQDISPRDQVAFARCFGDLEIHPVFRHHPDCPELAILGGDARSGRENIFHTDVTFREKPSMGSILRCVECPPCGGDTIWVNMAAAYQGLPEHIKSEIAHLEAVHDLAPNFLDRADPSEIPKLRASFPPIYHPVVRTHPESGERILFVNEGFVTHLANYLQSPFFMTMSEFRTSERALLDYLFSVSKRPEYQVRLRWRKNTVVFWDNRATQHYAVQDYAPAPRQMLRATIIGDRPY